ncbi:MAG: hypothetical protein ACLS6O_00145 [Bifidobacterium sp.]
MTLENEINQLKLLRVSWAQQKADTRRDITSSSSHASNPPVDPREDRRQAARLKALSIHQTAA